MIYAIRSSVANLLMDVGYRLYPPMRCADCRVDTGAIGEFFNIHDQIWQDVTWRDGARFLCIGCLERRLVRRLGPEDFSDAPINDPERTPEPFLSDRMLDRLGLL